MGKLRKLKKILAKDVNCHQRLVIGDDTFIIEEVRWNDKAGIVSFSGRYASKKDSLWSDMLQYHYEQVVVVASPKKLRSIE